MARSKFELVYSDGTRKQIGSAERTSLMLSQQIKQVGSQKYKFIGHAQRFDSFVDLAQWYNARAQGPQEFRHFLANLAVVFELAEEKSLQLEETPEAFTVRLHDMGCAPA